MQKKNVTILVLICLFIKELYNIKYLQLQGCLIHSFCVFKNVSILTESPF